MRIARGFFTIAAICAAMLLPAILAAQQSIPRTILQTSAPYSADIDIRTDGVIVCPLPAGAERVDPGLLKTWSGKGYDIWAAFPLSCAECALQCVEDGASAICPEASEIWVEDSPAFKKEWRDFYGSDWLDPASSPDAAFRAARLKAHLCLRSYENVFGRIQKKDPNVLRLIPMHGLLDNAHQGIVFSHAAAFRSSFVDGMIAQVETANAPIKYEGKQEAHAFENAYLEYSYFANLARDTTKPVWFLIDPFSSLHPPSGGGVTVASIDTPYYTRPDYRQSFHETLTAALMFPEVVRYEVAREPERTVGAGTQIPQSYATELLNIWAALRQMSDARPEICRRAAGTEGIGVVTADTVSWQRTDPQARAIDSFYGLSLPLLARGIPVQTTPLERVWDESYLQDLRILLLSYDIAKPLKEGYNTGLAGWVKRGGVLVVFGGSDSYNGIESWWRDKGFGSPTQHLLAQLGFGKDAHSLSARTLTDGDAIRFEGTPQERIDVRDHSVTGSHTITTMTTASAKVLASCNGVPIVSVRGVGKGSVILCGLPPAYFAESPVAAQLLADITRYAVTRVKATPYVGEEKALRYTESVGITVRRGKYVVARAMNAAQTIPGRYLNLLDPSIGYVTDPKLAIEDCALLYDLDRIEERKIPRVLLTSGKIEKKYESARETSIVLTGPEGRIGVGRIYAPKQKPSAIKSFDTGGNPTQVEAVWDEGSKTLLFLHKLSPAGSKIMVSWSDSLGSLPPPGPLHQALQ